MTKLWGLLLLNIVGSAISSENTPEENEAFHYKFAELLSETVAKQEFQMQQDCGLVAPSQGEQALDLATIRSAIDTEKVSQCTERYRPLTEALGCAAQYTQHTDLLWMVDEIVNHSGFANFQSWNSLTESYSGILSSLVNYSQDKIVENQCTCNAYDVLEGLEMNTTARQHFDDVVGELATSSQEALDLGVGSAFYNQFYEAHSQQYCSGTPAHAITALSVCMDSREELIATSLALFLSDLVFGDLSSCTGFNSGSVNFWHANTCLLGVLPLAEKNFLSELNLVSALSPLTKALVESLQMAAFQACGSQITGGSDEEVVEILLEEGEPRTIQDGPEDEFYASNSNLAWLVRVPQGKAVKLEFSRLFTEEEYDVITVYDGDSRASPIIASLSGEVLDPDDPRLGNPVRSSGRAMLITFTSDQSVESFGFSATVTVDIGQSGSGEDEAFAAVRQPFGDALVYFPLQDYLAGAGTGRPLGSEFHFTRIFPALPGHQVYAVFSHIRVPEGCKLRFFDGDLTDRLAGGEGLPRPSLRSYRPGRRPYFSSISSAGATTSVLTCELRAGLWEDTRTLFRVRYASDHRSSHYAAADQPHCRLAHRPDQCQARTLERQAKGLPPCAFFEETRWSYLRRRFVKYGCQDAGFCRFQAHQDCARYADRCARFAGFCLNRSLLPPVDEDQVYNQCARLRRPESECDPEDCSFVRATVVDPEGGNQTFNYGCQDKTFCGMDQVPAGFRARGLAKEALRQQCEEHSDRGCVFNEANEHCSWDDGGGVIET